MAKPLEGGLAKTVYKALKKAKLTLPATLIKITPGERTPDDVSSGTHPTTANYAARGIVSDYQMREIDGTLIVQGDRLISLFGASIAGGQVPTPDDQIVIEGTTYTITGPVRRDAAKVVYLCNGRA